LKIPKAQGPVLEKYIVGSQNYLHILPDLFQTMGSKRKIAF
jgi:hypothetical protein